jgi:hypothetical protein
MKIILIKTFSEERQTRKTSQLTMLYDVIITFLPCCACLSFPSSAKKVMNRRDKLRITWEIILYLVPQLAIVKLRDYDLFCNLSTPRRVRQTAKSTRDEEKLISRRTQHWRGMQIHKHSRFAVNISLAIGLTTALHPIDIDGAIYHVRGGDVTIWFVSCA